jgi:hypothetical protein
MERTLAAAAHHRLSFQAMQVSQAAKEEADAHLHSQVALPVGDARGGRAVHAQVRQLPRRPAVVSSAYSTAGRCTPVCMHAWPGRHAQASAIST